MAFSGDADVEATWSSASDPEEGLRPRHAGWSGASASGWRAAVLAGGCVAALALLKWHSSEGGAAADVSGAVSLGATWGDGGVGNLAAQSPAPAASLTPMPPQASPELDRYFKMMMGVPHSGEKSDNNNDCYENEEMHHGLCYKQCKLLTNGTHPLRTSAWTCCSAKQITSCFVNNQAKDFGLCSGYDVAGDGKSCPRTPGRCLANEEMFLGQCYQKCSTLTNGTKPYRTSPVSCCATQLSLSDFSCFSPSNIHVSKAYTQGGGAGDGDSSTPASAHAPATTPQGDTYPTTD